jgi:hypothetical protein
VPSPVRVYRRNYLRPLTPHTRLVARPSTWGNRFSVLEHGREEAIRLYRELQLPQQAESARRELRGWNLACYCKPGEACHADLLLDGANS